MKTIELEWEGIPSATLRANAALKGHWAQRLEDGKALKEIGFALAREYIDRWQIRGPICTPVAIRIYVRYPRASIDLDNLAPGYKYVLDGIQKAGLMLRDNVGIVKEYSLIWIGRGEPLTRLTIVDRGDYAQLG